MAAEFVPTPIDEATGIPLPLVPRDEVLELLSDPGLNAACRAGRQEFADWNHAYHPRLSPVFKSDSGRALRDCRGQLVLRGEHNAYHAAYDGPPLPRTAAERFRGVVFAVAGYVPRQALDFSGDSPAVTDLSDGQLARLQTSGEISPMQTVAIRKFLQRYVLEDPAIEHIPSRLVDEFLTIRPETADDRRRQRFLSHKLLSLVIYPVTAPLHETYRESLQEQCWHPDVHSSPRDVVYGLLVGQGRYRRSQNIRKIGGVLFDALSRQRGDDAAAEDSLAVA